jgi:hypothetical protein
MDRFQHRNTEAGIENLRQTGIEMPLGVIHDESAYLATLPPRAPMGRKRPLVTGRYWPKVDLR